MKEKEKPSDTLGGPKPLYRRSIGDEEYDVSKYKLLPALRKRNESWEKFKPRLVEDPHGHTYCDINDKTGKVQIYSAPMGGHFHLVEIVWDTDKQGNKFIRSTKCGPPLQWTVVKDLDGSKRKEALPVRWATAKAGQFIHDEHTHDIEYTGSQILSKAQTRKQVEADRAKIAHLIGPALQQAMARQQQELAAATPKAIDTGGAQISEL